MAEPVPLVSETVRNGTWKINFEEKSTTVPQESRNDISNPWISILKNWQKWPLSIGFGGKINKGPWKFKNSHNWSFGEKFKEFTSLVPELCKLAELVLGGKI